VKGANGMEWTPSGEIGVALPGSREPIKLPLGWSQASERSDVVTIIGPEGDLRVVFVVCALDGTPEEIACRAWRAFDPAFDFPALRRFRCLGPAGRTRAFRSSTTFRLQSRVAPSPFCERLEITSIVRGTWYKGFHEPSHGSNHGGHGRLETRGAERSEPCRC
jgi:hypothetical protein